MLSRVDKYKKNASIVFQCEWEETELLESYDVSMLRPSAVESKDKMTNICSQMQHASIKLAKLIKHL